MMDSILSISSLRLCASLPISTRNARFMFIWEAILLIPWRFMPYIEFAISYRKRWQSSCLTGPLRLPSIRRAGKTIAINSQTTRHLANSMRISHSKSSWEAWSSRIQEMRREATSGIAQADTHASIC